MSTLDLPTPGITTGPLWATKIITALTTLNADKVDSVIVATGTEPRPSADVVVWIDPDGLGAENALDTDPVITPGVSAEPGAPGPGVAAGGTTGQMLAKNSNTDYDTEWVDAPSGGGGSSVGSSGTGSFFSLPGVVITEREDISHEIGRIKFVPIEFKENVTLTGIACDFFGITGTGGVLRVALYERPSMSVVGDLAASVGSIAVAGGSIAKTEGLSVAIAAGFYWLAWWMDGQGTLTAASTRQLRIARQILDPNSFQEAIKIQSVSTLSPGAAWPDPVTTEITSGDLRGPLYCSVALKWTA